MKRLAGGVVLLFSLGGEKGSWAQENPGRADRPSACSCCVYREGEGWAWSKRQMLSVKARACSVEVWDIRTHCEGSWGSHSSGGSGSEHSPTKQRHKATMHWQLKHLSLFASLWPRWNDHRSLQAESERINRNASSTLVHKHAGCKQISYGYWRNMNS